MGKYGEIMGVLVADYREMQKDSKSSVPGSVAGVLYITFEQLYNSSVPLSPPH